MTKTIAEEFKELLEQDLKEAFKQEEFFKGKNLPEVLCARRYHRDYIENLLDKLQKLVVKSENPEPIKVEKNETRKEKA